MKRRLTTIALLAGVFALGACKSSSPDVLPPDPSGGAYGSGSGYGSGQDGGYGFGQDGGLTNKPFANQVGSQGHFDQAVGGRTVVYFDTDRFNIDSSDAATLSEQAQYLMQHPNLNVTLEGHCDERGTREYNLALGERRANAAKNYLVSLGVNSNRIRTVSFGKERPAALGSDEQSWASNRRAVTMIVS